MFACLLNLPKLLFPFNDKAYRRWSDKASYLKKKETKSEEQSLAKALL